MNTGGWSPDNIVPSGGSDVTVGSSNGKLKVDGVDITVYDDTAVRALIGGSSSSLAGKKINCLGDSITWGATSGATPWTTMIQNDYGCTVRNYGVSGATFTDNGSVFSMSYRYPNMNNDADIIVVWGGWNDINIGRTLGTFADRVATTFYGALHLMLDGLQTKYLGKKIFICTIMDFHHTWATVQAWNKAVMEVSEYWGVPVIDMARVGFSSRNASVKTNLVPDNIHPNTAGNQIIANLIAKAIS